MFKKKKILFCKNKNTGRAPCVRNFKFFCQHTVEKRDWVNTLITRGLCVLPWDEIACYFPISWHASKKRCEYHLSSIKSDCCFHKSYLFTHIRVFVLFNCSYINHSLLTNTTLISLLWFYIMAIIISKIKVGSIVVTYYLLEMTYFLIL